MSADKGSESNRVRPSRILPRMHPELRPYFQHVFPLFWPWLWWNLIRFAVWHQRTGQDALLAVDCFGNIRIVRLADAPKAEDLYTYEAPEVMPWERLAPEPLLLGERGLTVRGPPLISLSAGICGP